MPDFASFLISDPVGIQAFWVWLTLGVIVLGLEIMLGTEWLLWPAASAGVVALLTLAGLPIGFVFQVIIFSVLTLTLSILSRRLMKKDAPAGDINDPGLRLVGKTATVVEGFGSSHEGRVIFDGVEWPAVIEGDEDARLKAREPVKIVKVSDGKLVISRAA